jgi:hypothetical protein
MQSDRDPSVFTYSAALAGSSTTTIVPEVQKQQSTANLGIAATINFDFNTDTDPVFDLFVFADQALTVNVFIRQDATDTFRLLNNAPFAIGIANVLGALLSAQRFPGSQVRVQLQNLSGVATTVLSAQVHARSVL